ncbi:CCN family member 5 isoform X1 [Pan paniscus]|uniref:CCN family member 5 isoform X1 n=1 Tax=Pan paniscus TaxID=9597 RepID=UPI003005702F
MRGTPKTHLLAFSLLCLLSKVRTQLCPTPCTCPWPPPRCPLGVPLVLDGCGCCRVCARRLGESCDQLHVCDASQGLVCQPGAGPGGRGALCLLAEDDSSCEVNGRLYREGETFQPHCSIRCRCEDGGFTCVPLCSEDVRLPSWDCPHPRRVEVLGKCCPEWVCGQGGGLGTQPLPAQGERSGGPGQGGTAWGRQGPPGGWGGARLLGTRTQRHIRSWEGRRLRREIRKRSGGPGAVVHPCNPSTLGGQDGRIT